MPKLPYMKFYVGDFVGATRALSFEKKGMYIDLLCHLWMNAPTGEMSFLWEDLQALWKCDLEVAKKMVLSLTLNHCIVAKEFEHPNGHFGVHILQKRIKRDKKHLKANAFRQVRHRIRSNALVTPVSRFSNGKVTPKKSEDRSQKTEVRKEEDTDTSTRPLPAVESVSAPPSEPEEETAAPKPEDLIALWNAKAHPNLPRVRDVTETRKRHIRARLSEHPDQAYWEEVLSLVNRSRFLTGQSADWRCNFDWVISPSNLAKVTERTYDNKR